MKKLTKSVLAVVLTASFTVSYAQKSKVDSTKTKDIEGVVVTALGIKREKIFRVCFSRSKGRSNF